MKKKLTKIILSIMAVTMLIGSSMTVFACDQCDTQLVRPADHNFTGTLTPATTVKANHARMVMVRNNVSGHYNDSVNTYLTLKSGSVIGPKGNYLEYSWDNGAYVNFENGTYKKPDGTILKFNPSIFGTQYQINIKTSSPIDMQGNPILVSNAESFAHLENATIEKIIQLGGIPANVMEAWGQAAIYDHKYAETYAEMSRIWETNGRTHSEASYKKTDEGWEYNNKEHEYYELGLERLYGLQ